RWIVGFAGAFVCQSMGAPTLGMAVLFLSFPAYYLAFEGGFGRTPAKYLTRTRVITVAGGRPTFGQILGRTFARLVPFEPFSFFGRSPDGWHDRSSRT